MCLCWPKTEDWEIHSWEFLGWRFLLKKFIIPKKKKVLFSKGKQQWQFLQHTRHAWAVQAWEPPPHSWWSCEPHRTKCRDFPADHSPRKRTHYCCAWLPVTSQIWETWTVRIPKAFSSKLAPKVPSTQQALSKVSLKIQKQKMPSPKFANLQKRPMFSLPHGTLKVDKEIQHQLCDDKEKYRIAECLESAATRASGARYKFWRCAGLAICGAFIFSFSLSVLGGSVFRNFQWNFEASFSLPEHCK